MTAERAYEDDARFANPADHHIAHVEQCVHDLILQEIITLSVFAPFAIFYMKERLTLDYLWASLCLAGVVFFLFRSRWVGT